VLREDAFYRHGIGTMQVNRSLYRVGDEDEAIGGLRVRRRRSDAHGYQADGPPRSGLDDPEPTPCEARVNAEDAHALLGSLGEHLV
jgi:hypothetical protein